MTGQILDLYIDNSA